MPYYIAPWVGLGTSLNPFIPYKAQDYLDWSVIDLRPDGGASLGGGGLNACLLWLPDDLSDPQLQKLALDKFELVSVIAQRRIKTRLALSNLYDFSFPNFNELVATLLLSPPPGAWRRVRSRVLTQIWLGPATDKLLFSQPVVAGGVTLTESFNKANNGLGPDLSWSQVGGTGWVVLTNQAHMTENLQAIILARADSDLATDDHYAQAQLTLTATVNYCIAGPIVRKDATATMTYYVVRLFQGAASQYDLYKSVAGTLTALGSADTTTTYTAGATIKISADGSTISAYKNGVALSMSPQTDTAIAGNLRTGLYGYTESGSLIDADVFQAEDVAAGGATLTPPAGSGALAGQQPRLGLGITPGTMIRES